ncbi:MAG: substrate-binding domain-containing protein [Jatrophihabitans sp.]|uniref:substrate-binding domain-containing protein n=1 Tax=Jatrophihabitans sp. TaxID=1932789 RepID=UPI0039163CA8
MARTIGLVVSDVANPFFAELAGEFQRRAAGAGYATILCNSDEDAGRQDDYLATLLAGRQVDGVVLVPTAAMTPGILAAGEAGARLVLFDRPIDCRGTNRAATHLATSPVVRSDATAALDEVAELLVRLGHRRIGIIAPPLQTQVGRERRDLLRDALIARGIDRRAIAVVEGDFRQDSGARAVESLLSRRQPPTALFAADGLMAVGALQGLRSAALRVPHDISLVGFDDAPWFDVFDPPLTVVAQPVATLARAAVTAVLDLIAGRKASGARPACRFVRRMSCGVPPSGEARTTSRAGTVVRS